MQNIHKVDGHEQLSRRKPCMPTGSDIRRTTRRDAPKGTGAGTKAARIPRSQNRQRRHLGHRPGSSSEPRLRLIRRRKAHRMASLRLEVAGWCLGRLFPQPFPLGFPINKTRSLSPKAILPIPSQVQLSTAHTRVSLQWLYSHMHSKLIIFAETPAVSQP